jgi:hypothetical protein
MSLLLRVVLLGGFLGIALPLLLTPRTAFAHERREVGKYQLVVGFLNEPAYQGQMNAAYFAITDREAQKPVEGLDKTLKVSVAFGGGQSKEFSLRPRPQMPGQYIADFIPTRPGSYVFTFTGMIEGLQVNERFESGPGRVNDIEPATAVQFPVPETSTSELQQSLSEARQQAVAANNLALAGLGLGALSLLLSGPLLLGRRSGASASAPQTGRAG